MRKFTKILRAAAVMAAISTSAMAQPAAPDTTPKCAPITATIYFAVDQAKLSTAAAAALQAEAELVEGCAVSTIETTATSTDGDEALSQARSKAVISALSGMGIATTETRTEVTGAPTGRLIATARHVELTLTTLPTLNNS